MEEKRKNKTFILCSSIAAVLGVVAIVFGLLTTNKLKSNGNIYQDEKTLGNIAGCETEDKTYSCPNGTSSKSDGNCYGNELDDSVTQSVCVDNMNGYYYGGVCYGTKTSPNVHSECIKCQGGYELKSGYCVSCQTGEYGYNGITCATCADGKWSDSLGSVSCADCPAGYACKDHSKTKCTGSYYSQGGESGCTKCNGTVTTTNGLNTGCVECGAGQGWLAEQNKCSNCSAGHYSPANDNECRQCVNGTYQNLAGQATCNYLPSHSTANTDKTDFICDAGYYKNGSSCTACPDGYTSSKY